MRSKFVLVACAANLVWVSQANAQSEDLSPEELAEIEAALSSDAAEVAAVAPSPAPVSTQSMNPDMGLVLDTALAAFSEDETLQSGAHDPFETGFRLQQLELVLKSNVDPFFRVDANLVFSREEGVDLEEAYGTTLALPYSLQSRVGAFLSRFGRINSTHPHSWDFTDQPFWLGKVFGGEGNRQVGVEVSWLSPLPWYVELVGSLQNANGEETARSFYGADDLGIDDPRDLQATGAAKQFFELSDNWSLSWGLSVATGPNSSGPGKRSNLLGTDLYLKYRPVSRESTTMLILQAEYIYRRRQVPGDLLRDHGGYAYALWKYARRWDSALRYEFGSPARGRDGDIVIDPLDPAWTSNRHRVSATTTFRPSEFSRLRAELSADDPTWLADPIYGAMFTLEFVFGAHGAHQY